MYKIDQPSIKNSTLTDYIKAQSRADKIKEWSICIVSNTDERVFIDHDGKTHEKGRKPNENISKYNVQIGNELFSLGCTVRNQLNGRSSEYYLISKNQIDQAGDRQVDLTFQNKDYSYSEIKEQRKLEKKGLLLIYSLDERCTPHLNNGIPIVGYSIHFPKIDDEVKVSYTATINKDFDRETMVDDDDPEIEDL
jgi:hypothetical protein